MSGKVQPTSLTVEQTAQILTAAGGREVTEDMVRADIESGAPTHPDGTINLMHYAAWLVKEMALGD